MFCSANGRRGPTLLSHLHSNTTGNARHVIWTSRKPSNTTKASSNNVPQACAPSTLPSTPCSSPAHLSQNPPRQAQHQTGGYPNLLFFISDVNYEMDVGLHGWVVQPVMYQGTLFTRGLCISSQLFSKTPYHPLLRNGRADWFVRGGFGV